MFSRNPNRQIMARALGGGALAFVIDLGGGAFILFFLVLRPGRSRCFWVVPLNHHALHLIEGDVLIAPIVEPGGACGFMGGHLLRES